MQLATAKHKADLREKELSDSRAQLDQCRAQMAVQVVEIDEKEAELRVALAAQTELQARVDPLELSLSKVRDRLREAERNAAASALMKAEQEATLNALRKDLKSSVEAQNALAEQLRTLSSQAGKAEELQGRLTELLNVEAQLRSELDEKNALVTRLRSEASAAEKKNAVRTAMLAAAEAQVETLSRQLKEHAAVDQEASSRLLTLQAFK